MVWSFLLLSLREHHSGRRLSINFVLRRRVTTTMCASSSTRQIADPSSEAWKVVLLALIFYLVVFHSLSNLPLSNPLLFGIHQRFWMHPNILMFILIGIGGEKLILSASNGSPSRLLALATMVLLLPFTAYWQKGGLVAGVLPRKEKLDLKR